MVKIGSRIFYDLATGNIIQVNGERQGEGGTVTDTTIEQDFAAYVSLAERVPATVGYIQLEYGQYAQEFMSGNNYHVDIATQIVIFDTTPPVPVLDVVKQRKLEDLLSSRNIALETFTSSALGTPHTYLSRAASIPNDMLLLTSEYSFVSGINYDNQPITWYTIEEGNVTHTAAQIIQVYLDARAYVQTQMVHCGTLNAQVDACTTVDAVNAIVW